MTYLVKVRSEKKVFYLISNFPPLTSDSPLQAKMLPTRLCLMLGVKKLIVSPHAKECLPDGSQEKLKCGDLFIMTDHVNISAYPSGTGPNIPEFGQRFYDIASIYDPEVIKVLKS